MPLRRKEWRKGGIASPFAAAAAADDDDDDADADKGDGSLISKIQKGSGTRL